MSLASLICLVTATKSSDKAPPRRQGDWCRALGKTLPRQSFPSPRGFRRVGQPDHAGVRPRKERVPFEMWCGVVITRALLRGTAFRNPPRPESIPEQSGPLKSGLAHRGGAKRPPLLVDGRPRKLNRVQRLDPADASSARIIVVPSKRVKLGKGRNAACGMGLRSGAASRAKPAGAALCRHNRRKPGLR